MMSNKENILTIGTFIGRWLTLQKESFLYDLLEQIQNSFDEGMTFEEIKKNCGYDPLSPGFQAQAKIGDDINAELNEYLINLLQLGEAHKFIRFTGKMMDVDGPGIKKALEEKLKPKSNIILLH